MTDTAAPAAPLNRRQQAKARTRQKVLDASTALFAEVGYHAATIRDIAKRAGMSTGAVFANFADKEAIYRTIYGHDPITPEQGADFLAFISCGAQLNLPDFLDWIADRIVEVYGAKENVDYVLSLRDRASQARRLMVAARGGEA